MGLIDNIRDIFFPAIEGLFNGSLDSYCDIETVDGPNIIMKDGSICTLLRFDGSSRLMGNDALFDTSQILSEKFSPMMQREGNVVQVIFTRSPDTTEDIVKDILMGPRNTARRLNMDFTGLFDEQEMMLRQEIYNETCYIALWTRSSTITKEERKTEIEQSRTALERFSGTFFTQSQDIQSLITKSRILVQRHEGFVSNVIFDMESQDFIIRKLVGNEAVNAIVNNIYPYRTGDNFRLRAPWSEHDEEDSLSSARATSTAGGQRKGYWMRPNAQDDAAFLLWPKVGEQIFVDDAEYLNSNIVRIGHIYASSVAVSLGQQNLTPFNKFVSSMPRMPFRVCFTFEGDGLSGMKFKEILASIARITNKGHNTPIRDEINALTSIRNNGNSLYSTIAKIRINFATWSPVSMGRDEVERRTVALMGAVERWGNIQATSSSGDPLSGVLSSVGGLTLKSTAPIGAAPLPDITYMLPLQRETSPWDTGWPFKTNDNRLFPYMLGSSKQDTFADMIYATPGKGKSVLLNTLNFAFCTSEQNVSGTGGAMLPRCSIIDIGFSSEGFIVLLKQALPDNRKHEVLHLRMSMDPKESAVNIFDTPLGCRHPIDYDRSFIINFLSVFMEERSSDGHVILPQFTDALIGMFVDELYRMFTDDLSVPNATPKIYRKGTDFEVDEAIRKYGINAIENETPWWTIVDTLSMGHEDHVMAARAQRYAVPLISDIYSMDETSIEKTYGEAQHKGMNLIKMFKMALMEINSNYPILNAPTVVDLASARVVALDLQYVCGDDPKKTSLMYMLGRFLCTKGFFYGPQDINMFEAKYRKYHYPVLKRNQATAKRIVMDEFHKTEGSLAVRKQVVKDMREGRKWKVQISLASQMLDDFTPEIRGLVSTTFILGTQGEDARKSIKTFNLSELAGNILSRSLNGPAPRVGAPMLALVTTKDGGTQEHYVFNKLSPQYIWAFSTTREDADLRGILYERLGVSETLRILARRFPTGSAKTTLERLNKENSRNQGGNYEEEQRIDAGVINTLAEDLTRQSQMQTNI